MQSIPNNVIHENDEYSYYDEQQDQSASLSSYDDELSSEYDNEQDQILQQNKKDYQLDNLLNDS